MCPTEEPCESNPAKVRTANEDRISQSSPWFNWKQRGHGRHSVRLHVTLDLFNKVSVGAPPRNKDPVDTGVQLRGEFTD